MKRFLNIILGWADPNSPSQTQTWTLSCVSLCGSVATLRRLCKHFLHSTVRVEGYSLGWTHSFIKVTFKTFLPYQHCQEQAVYCSHTFTLNQHCGWKQWRGLQNTTWLNVKRFSTWRNWLMKWIENIFPSVWLLALSTFSYKPTRYNFASWSSLRHHCSLYLTFLIVFTCSASVLKYLTID